MFFLIQKGRTNFPLMLLSKRNEASSLDLMFSLASLSFSSTLKKKKMSLIFLNLINLIKRFFYICLFFLLTVCFLSLYLLYIFIMYSEHNEFPFYKFIYLWLWCVFYFRFLNKSYQTNLFSLNQKKTNKFFQNCCTIWGLITV